MVIKRFAYPLHPPVLSSHNLLPMDLVVTFMQHGGVHVTVHSLCNTRTVPTPILPQAPNSGCSTLNPPVSPLAFPTKQHKFQSFFARNEAAIWTKLLQYVNMLWGRRVLAKLICPTANITDCSNSWSSVLRTT